MERVTNLNESVTWLVPFKANEEKAKSKGRKRREPALVLEPLNGPSGTSKTRGEHTKVELYCTALWGSRWANNLQGHLFLFPCRGERREAKQSQRKIKEKKKMRGRRRRKARNDDRNSLETRSRATGPFQNTI